MYSLPHISKKWNFCMGGCQHNCHYQEHRLVIHVSCKTMICQNYTFSCPIAVQQAAAPLFPQGAPAPQQSYNDGGRGGGGSSYGGDGGYGGGY